MSNNSNCNTTCPACGKPGLQLFSSIECYTQPDCSNYRAPEATKPPAQKSEGFYGITRGSTKGRLGFQGSYAGGWPPLTQLPGSSCTDDTPECSDKSCAVCFYQDDEDDDSDFEREETDPGIGPQTWLRVSYCSGISRVYKPGDHIPATIMVFGQYYNGWGHEWESLSDYEPAEGWPKLDRYGKPIVYSPMVCTGVNHKTGVITYNVDPFAGIIRSTSTTPTYPWNPNSYEGKLRQLAKLNEEIRKGQIAISRPRIVLDMAKEKPQAVNPGPEDGAFEKAMCWEIAASLRRAEEQYSRFPAPEQPCTGKEPSEPHRRKE